MRVVQLSVSALLVVLSCSAATVLVTGGMGGLGRSVVTELLRWGHSVVSLDVRDRRTELAALGGDLSNHRFVRGDVRNTSLLAEIFRAGVEGIVHLAALSGQACENRPELCRSVNVGGTRALVSVLEAGHDIAVPPWLVLGSTTEVFGDQCATAACTEESSTAPVTVFGTTMLQAEDVLGQSRLRFRGLLLLRFSDLYGDVWERTGRVARLVLAARASQVIDTSANESVLLLNLVSLVDAAVVVGKAVDLLQSGLTPGYLELLLVCSGLATPYDQTVDAVLALTASSSPLRQTDELGSSFLGDPSRLKRVLGVSVGGDLASGLRAYVLGVLAVELSQLLTSQESTACAHTLLDVAALDGCAVFVTVFGDFPDDVEYRAQHHLVAAAELRRIDVTRRFHLLGLASGLDLDFALDLPDAYYEADYDASSGGYRLLVNADEPGAHTFNLSLPLPSSLGVEGTLLSLVSIRAYSCPPRVEGVARLPTDHYDPALYRLRQLSPETAPPLNCSVQCGRVRAAIHYNLAQQQRLLTSKEQQHLYRRSNNFSAYAYASLPLCDAHCDIPGGCVNTGACRCGTAYCGHSLDLDLDLPDDDDDDDPPDLSDTASSPAPALPLLPYAARLLGRGQLPKIHVLSVDVLGLCNCSSQTKLYNHAGFASGFNADFLFEEGFSGQGTSLEDAEVVYVPFRLYKSMLVLHSIAGENSCLAAVHEYATRRLGDRPAVRLVYSMSHDYGGAVTFNWDMRNFVGGSLRQNHHLAESIVLSPLGDFNSLAYLPHKDVVVPPASAKTPALLEAFKTSRQVKPSAERRFLVFFSGSVDKRTGSVVRAAVMSETLYPKTKDRLLNTAHSGAAYLTAINESVFCPHVLGVVGWSFRLSDVVYGGCIPVLTSDVTHPPFADVLDWSKFSVFVDWRNLEDLEAVLLSLSPQEVAAKQAQLMQVRHALLFDRSRFKEEVEGRALGPLFLSLVSIKMRLATSFPVY